MSDPDRNEDDQDGCDEGDTAEGQREQVERGGIMGWFARYRDRAELRRDLRQAREENDELKSTIESLRADNEALENTVSTYRRKTFDLDDLMRKLGDAAASAEDDLTDSPLGVADLEVDLRAHLTGAGDESTVGIQLLDPDDDVDPARVSTFNFRFDRESAAVRRDNQARDRVAGQMLGAAPEAQRGQVPDVRHLTLEAAREALADAGFGSVEASGPSGTVVDQSPEPHAIGPTDATIELEVVANDENETDDGGDGAEGS